VAWKEGDGRLREEGRLDRVAAEEIDGEGDDDVDVQGKRRIRDQGKGYGGRRWSGGSRRQSSALTEGKETRMIRIDRPQLVRRGWQRKRSVETEGRWRLGGCLPMPGRHRCR
jgi:hypothetical protein